MNDKTLLLIDCGPAYKREKVIEQILKNNYKVVLMLNNLLPKFAIDWTHKYFASLDIIYTNFIEAKTALSDVKVFLQENKLELSGVFTYQEHAVPLTNFLAKSFNLPVISNGDEKAARHKGIMRKLFTNAGIEQPIFRVCKNFEEVVAAVRELGTPCVIKPSEMMASLGVFKVSEYNEAELKQAYLKAKEVDIPDLNLRDAYGLSNDVIVEEYIVASREISVEGATYNGNLEYFMPTKKFLSPEPFFHEIGHIHPTILEPDQESKIKKVLINVVKALGLQNTVFHAEFRFEKSSGNPILVEIAARAAGDSIPTIVDLAKGVDLLAAGVQLALGNRYDFSPKCNKVSAVMFFDKKFDSVDLEKNPLVNELCFYKEPDEGRAGHMFLLGENSEELEELMREFM